MNYAVGMIVEFDDYTCEPTRIGVIVGWGRDVSSERIRLYNQDRQHYKMTKTIPYYEVFFGDDKTFFLPQGMIELSNAPDTGV